MTTNEAEWVLAQRFTTALQKTLSERLLAVALFGSAARGQARPDSDIDLLVIVEDDPSAALRDALAVRQTIEPTLTPRLSLLVATPKRLRQNLLLLLDISDHSIILHDPQNVLSDLLTRLRERLCQWGSRKIVLPDGTWVWQLKPDWRPGEVLDLTL